ncbi:hypothetical protein C8A00DRAFT_33574 [Chaetomidium leptoderma]|uniref:Uncharacterized protein n=1 Tax=Chaetomidium leptoderma TaxID=669021 RepID=A0AAN6ZXA2_9PEZI|nr:hypothetical protein C8A00DRAFT_33574 [Chaetomidium leptoderma]
MSMQRLVCCWNGRTFPLVPEVQHVPAFRRPMVWRALNARENEFGMFIAAGLGGPLIGVLARIIDSDINTATGTFSITLYCTSRFRVVELQPFGDCTLANIEPYDDISAADEALAEARETAGYHSHDPSPPVTRENMGRLPTSVLVDSAIRVIGEHLASRRVAWFNRTTPLEAAQLATHPAVFPWWLVNKLPVGIPQRVRLLATTSRRERFKIC